MIDPNDPEKTLEDFELVWGVYDMQDKCWLGNDDGPLVYSHLLARACATIVNERMMVASRYRAKVFEGGPMRLRDVVQFRRAADEAIKRIEDRCPPGY